MEKGLSILVVDDDEVERLSLVRALAPHETEHKITQSDCAEEALKLLQNAKFDVVLLDYRLPGTNGIEFLFKLKNTPDVQVTAIVMVSNYADDKLLIEAIDGGAHDFLLKEDVTPAQLKRSILQSRKRSALELELFQSYQKVKNLAERDALTGLFNRYHFDESLLQILKAAKRNDEEIVAVMMLDLDKFKQINDTYGHSIGDLLIVEVGKRLQQVLRSNELLARFGGDEFALVCEHLKSLQDGKLVGNRIVKALEKPFSISGTVIHCSASIGMSIYPANGDSANELMKCADIAMYRAKQNVDQSLCVYKDNMQKEVLFKYKVESELREAYFSKDFTLHYQPIYRNGVVVGLEALLRWPKGKTTKRPDEFIPIAEECGVINRLGEWVLTQALEEMQDYLRNQETPIYLSINVSPRQLQSEKFSAFFIECLDRYNIEHNKIVIEITETVLLENDEVSLTTLKELSEAGIRLALDDFGTGYSSLSHLITFPIDIVKVDKSLLSKEITTGSRKVSVLKGLNLLLRELSLTAVVEGVETDEQATFCNALGLLTQQGYLYAKPQPKSKLKLQGKLALETEK